MNIAGFEKVAQYLTHPLVLVGFVLMLAYGVHTQLMKSGLLAQATKKDSALIIRLFLRYGFWLALVLLLAGFGLQFSGIGLSAWNSYMDKEKVVAVNAGKVAEQLYAQLDTKDQQLSTKDEQIKALTEAVTALAKADAPPKSVNDALRALEQGDTEQAQAIFVEVLRSKEAEGQQANKEAAAAARHLGALAFNGDTKAALAAYQKSVQLDPNNAEGWNQLGKLFNRTGELAQAEEIFRKVLALGEAHQNQEKQAVAYGNLGNMHYIRSDLGKAEEMHKKALALHESLGNNAGMAINYGNLGEIYRIHGELDKAEEMHWKALEFDKALGNKKGMAYQYGNLGNVYYTQRGELDRAEEMYSKSLKISSALGLKEVTANQYGNLGNVYQTRGELDLAEEMYRKALELNEALCRKEGMANQYGNLGFLYEKRGKLEQAEKMHRKSLILLQEMNHPDAQKVQQALDELARQKASSSQ
ncbi:MAG: tetratricopeptide repeat protein [Candidatus Electrothrix sp. AR5]|nr:tetratricopeptide repeat protein [Candidatus Electrothrix sp. AR5]